MSASAGLKLSLILLLVLVYNLDAFACSSNSSVNGDVKDQCIVPNPVELGVYFESLCPDSKRFFLNQLIPTYNEIGGIIQPNLIAFGHARVIGSNKMVCQHGARECENNRLMACISMQPKATDKTVLATIGCVFENKKTSEQCVNEHLKDVSYKEIEECRDSTSSFRTMARYEEETGHPTYIPHLTFNGQHSESIQEGLEFNLKRYVCEHFNGTKPDACKNLPEVRQRYS